MITQTNTDEQIVQEVNFRLREAVELSYMEIDEEIDLTISRHMRHSKYVTYPKKKIRNNYILGSKRRFKDMENEHNRAK